MGQLFLFTGDDEGTIGVRARAQVVALAGDLNDNFALEVVRERDDGTPIQALEQLLGTLRTPPMFAPNKTIWFQNFSAFGSEGKGTEKTPSPMAAGLARLAASLAAGLPAEVNVVLSGPDVDDTKPLYAACGKTGTVVVCMRPDLTRPNWRAAVEQLLREQARSRSLRLSPEVLDYLVEVIGTDTARIGPELEKLLCGAGTEPTLAATTALCVGTREAGAFALVSAFGTRDLPAAFLAIAQVSAHSKDFDGEAIRLVRQTAATIRELVYAKLLGVQLKATTPRQVMARLGELSAAEKEQLKGNPLVGRSVYYVQRRAEEAEHYRGPELVRALSLLAVTDRQCVSTSLPRRLLLEDLALRIIGGK